MGLSPSEATRPIDAVTSIDKLRPNGNPPHRITAQHHVILALRVAAITPMLDSGREVRRVFVIAPVLRFSGKNLTRRLREMGQLLTRPRHEATTEPAGLICDDCGCDRAQLRVRWTAVLCDGCRDQRIEATERKRQLAIDNANRELDQSAASFGDLPACTEGSRKRTIMHLLGVMSIMATTRGGLTVADVTEATTERLGDDYCDRTIRRDLESLEYLGYVTREEELGPTGRRQHRWYWTSPLQSLAETMDQARDGDLWDRPEWDDNHVWEPVETA